jgi:hypothetical protein
VAIITKPTIEKGTPALITLNKVELEAHPLVTSNPYFSDSTRWRRVEIIYISSPGNQSKDVKFDVSGVNPTPTGSILFSLKARDEFQVESLLIVDYDNGILQIPRESLNSADFDISLIEYINWNLTNGPTTNSVGAVLTNPSSQNWFYMMKSSTGYSSDFEVNYLFEGADCLEIGVGMADNTTLGVFTGSVAMINRSGTYFEINTNGDTWLPGQYSFNAAGTNTIKFSRIGSTVTVYLNGVSVHSYSSSSMLYPLGRPYFGNITSAYYKE